MPKVDVDFQIQEKGAAATKAKLDGLSRSTEQVGAKLPRVSEGLSRVASNIMGPLGVATGLALASERLIAFGEANANTEQQRQQFSRFRAELDLTTGAIGRATAEALTQSGTLEFLSGGVEILGSELEAVMQLFRALEPVLDIVSLGMQAAALPTVALGKGLELLADGMQPVLDALDDLGAEAKSAAGELLGVDSWIKATGKSAKEAEPLISGYTKALEKLKFGNEFAAAQRKEAEAAARKELDTQTQINTVYAAALKGKMDVVMIEGEARKAYEDSTKRLDKQAEALGRLKQRRKELIDLGPEGRTPEQASELLDLGNEIKRGQVEYNAVFEQTALIGDRLAEIDSGRLRSNKEISKEIERQTASIETQVNVLSAFIAGAAQGNQQAQAEAKAMDRRLWAFQTEMRDLEKYIKLKGVETKAVAKTTEENEKARAQATALEKIRTDSLYAEATAWAGVGEAAVGMIGKVADVGVAHAALAFAGAVTEIPGMIAVGDFAGAALMGIKAANAIVEQALGESMGGKKKGSSASGGASSASAASASVAPPSDLDRGGRGGDLTAVITVGNRAFGELAISSANAAARSGGQKLDRRVLGSSTRRGRITP